MLTDSTIERWLAEDVGHHDVTNQVPGETTGKLVAKEPGVAAGLDAAGAVFDYLGIDCDTTAETGCRISAGDCVLAVEGRTRDVLRGERVAVNLAGHASGIATKTRKAVDTVREVSEKVHVAGTRKTTPGLRSIEKRAIVAGGGDTHRLDLSHMMMVKDNHVAEMGIEEAIRQLRKRGSFTTKIEVEVEEPAHAPRAAQAGADIVLLDNMSPEETGRAVDTIRTDYPDVLVEASGAITIEDLPAYAATGVDVISMGSLTHSAEMLDYSFRTGDGRS
jgi:nicotinate-nucleotide pyrophosphorylase (carboxylating)